MLSVISKNRPTTKEILEIVKNKKLEISNLKNEKVVIFFEDDSIYDEDQ